MDLSRRGVLTAGLVCAACGARTLPAPVAPASPPTPPVTGASVPPTPSRWRPDAGDLHPEVKVAAARHVERRGATVIECQYGGLLPESACVLVVSRPQATFDVRLSRRGQRWVVTSMHPSRPGPPALVLTSAARHVLASERIDLPPAARADLASGQVHDSVCRAMLDLARAYRIGVSVVRSGHPTFVFGTDRASDHPRGRAFDTWRINDRSVVDPGTPRALVVGYMHAVAEAGSYNVGGPYGLGSAPQWFSDATHHDHVHAGFVA